MKVTEKFGNTYYTFDFDGDDGGSFLENFIFILKILCFIFLLFGIGWLFDVLT